MSYSPTLGRFLEMDPAHYIDGPNQYQIELSNPVNGLDPTGLADSDSPSVPNYGGIPGTIITGPSGNKYQWVANPSDPSRPVLVPYNSTSTTPPLIEVGGLSQSKVVPVVTPESELRQLRLAGLEWQQQDGMWTPRANECGEQAVSLQKYLQSKLGQGPALDTKYWLITVDGGATAIGIKHNVVKLVPINGNKMPTMMLDAFHGPQASHDGCETKPWTSFKREYPQNVKHSWWDYLKFWNW